MKKFLPALAITAVLGAAGSAVYLARQPAGGAAARWLPADTVLFLSLPDPARTLAEWKTTDLFQITQEPEVQAFLARPLAKLPGHKALDEAWEKAVRLQPRHLFAALTALDEKNNQPHFVAGFQFTGSSDDVGRLLAEPKEQLRKRYPAGKADLLNYQGHAVETFDTGDGTTLASTFLGDRYLIANDLALLKATLDRIEGRTAGTTGTTGGKGSLDQEPDFRAALAKMPADHATLIFARPRTLTRRLYDLLAASGQTISAGQRAEADKVRAVAAATRIEGGKLRDTLYTLAPGRRRAPAALQRKALAFTTADTLLYAAGIFTVPARLDLPAGAGPTAVLAQWVNALQGRGLTPESFRAAFGDEAALQLDWPASRAQPTLLASLDVRDAGAAAKFVQGFTADASAGWQATQADGRTLHTWSSPSAQRFVTPTLTLTNHHLLLGLDPEDVRAAAAREASPAANFTAGETYKTAVGGVPAGNLNFAYLDTRALFERAYGVVKPLAPFGAMFLQTKNFDAVDLNKLPSTEAIAKHLSPMVLSATEDEQGVLVESAGPLTVIQAAAGLSGIGAATAAVFATRTADARHPAPNAATAAHGGGLPGAVSAQLVGSQ